MNIIYIFSLQQAREILDNTTEKVVIVNAKNTEYSLGINVIIEIFEKLKSEYPDKITGFQINAGKSLPAFLTAKKLGFENIIFESE